MSLYDHLVRLAKDYNNKRGRLQHEGFLTMDRRREVADEIAAIETQLETLTYSISEQEIAKSLGFVAFKLQCLAEEMHMPLAELMYESGRAITDGTGEPRTEEVIKRFRSGQPPLPRRDQVFGQMPLLSEGDSNA